MRALPPCIRIRTCLRTGSGERLVEDRILRPLTSEERRRGVRDELREYIAEHGVPGARRKSGKCRPRLRERDPGCGTRLDMKFGPDGAPSKADQEAMYRLMRAHLGRVAYDLAASGAIGRDDIHDAEMELFAACRDSLKGWNPERAGLKTFLYERVASAKLDYLRYLKREKRAFSHPHLHMVSDPSDEDAGQASPASFSGTVGAESIADRHALEKMLFAWALSDLEAFLDADERLALDYLLQGCTQEETARWMSCTLMQFRRRILQSIQMKAVLCGFEPHNGTMICRG